MASIEIHPHIETAPLLEAMSKFSTTAGDASKSLHVDDIFTIFVDLRRHEESRPDDCKRPEPLDITRFFQELATSRDPQRALDILRAEAAIV